MKRIYIVFLFVLAALSGCQKPQYVEPTLERQGITSLTAYFTMGDYEGLELAKLTVQDPEADRFVIEVPYYYPITSDNSTKKYMSSLRIKAQLANNCKIDPPLTILDLNLENEFTFTDAQGNSRPIIITGKRVKSSECKIMTFKLTEPFTVEGFVNEDNKEIYLFTTDDLSNYKAEATVSAHAKLKDDLSQPRNYNEPQKVTVIADDGTEGVYTVSKEYPTKIPYGFREKSVTHLFNIDPVKLLSFPAYTSTVYPSLACIEGKLIVSFGNGTAPVYVEALTGSGKKEMNVGGINVACITNDEGGNLILTNHAEAAQTIEIYRTKSVSQAPVLFHSFTNDTDLATGYNVKVHGNIDSDAVIIFTHEGVAGVTEASKYTKVVVSGGAVVSTEVVDLLALGLTWGTAPTNAAKVVATSAKADHGVMMCYYSANTINYVNEAGAIAASFPLADLGVGINTNYNTNCMDAKTYNNATYAVHLTTSHFPMWGVGPMLTVFDITTPTSISKGIPVLANSSIEWFQTAAAGCAAADVVMAPSADGFKVFIFYFDHNCSVIGGYSADCINI